MKHSLMLIESPNKINTITKYLKNTNIEVFATIGHIRELDEKSYKGFGFEEKTYNMKWRNNSKRSFKGKEFDVIQEINKKAEKSDEIFLSTDPDREGEAIAWHIYSILSEKNQKKCKRIIFNEITQDAINKAFQHPRDLDQHQINSYLARKILDRGIGFKLSNFSQKFIGGVSAGRVQSIALKFLKDKYDEIQEFVPEHWFNVRVILENGLELTLKKLNDAAKVDLKDVGNGNINFVNEEEAQKFLETLNDCFDLVSIDDPKKEKRQPPKPFKTSTMQSTAISNLGFSVDNVDRIAQRLYEGVEIDGEFISLITYPRTDREDLSDTFVKEAKNWLLGEYGNDYVASIRKAKKKSADKELLVQGAHEAIRPTYINLTPRDLEGKIDGQFLRLYKLIWLRAVASLMKEATYDNVLYTFDNEGNEFVVNNRIETFDGFQRLIRNFKKKDEEVEDDEKAFPPLHLHEKYKSDEREVKRVDKKPPSPYTESTLIKSLEDRGIGRPSTYSHIVNIILKREYANKVEGKLIITELGIQMSQELSKFFPNVMQYDYTKNMEQSLDNISEDKSDWKEFLDDVFLVFNGELENALNQVKNLVVGVCPECGGFLKKKYSIRGPKRSSFVGCDNYPKCKYIQHNQDEKSEAAPVEKTGELCPECGGDLVKKMSKWKKPFIGCSKYPTCSYIKRNTPQPEEVGRDCPKCKGKLLKKFNKWNRPFISCQKYPECKYIESLDEKEKTDELCPECGGCLWKCIGRYNRPYLKCESENCKFHKTIKKDSDDTKTES